MPSSDHMRSAAELIRSNARPQIRRRVRSLIQLFGYDVRAIDDYPNKRPIDFIRSRKIDVVVDVGANTGQYGQKLRDAGYRGWIVSLEPVRESFEALKSRASNDPHWMTLPFALGREHGQAMINVSEAAVFSSLRPQTPAAIAFNPEARVVRREAIETMRLDELLPTLPPGHRFLKIDTQGYEQEILGGGIKCLSEFIGIQMELPIKHLYEEVWRFDEALSYMVERGFELSNMIPVNYDPQDTVSLLEIDCIFRRRAIP
jgi:FkbM family methyltransferase